MGVGLKSPLLFCLDLIPGGNRFLGLPTLKLPRGLCHYHQPLCRPPYRLSPTQAYITGVLLSSDAEIQSVKLKKGRYPVPTLALTPASLPGQLLLILLCHPLIQPVEAFQK